MLNRDGTGGQGLVAAPNLCRNLVMDINFLSFLVTFFIYPSPEFSKISFCRSI